MSTSRVALSAALIALLVVPSAATAQDVTFAADRPCYSPHDLVLLTGHGFTSDGDVSLSVGGQQLGVGFADFDGVFNASLRAPALPFPEFALRFTATDQTYRLNRASTNVRITSLGLQVAPTTGDAARPRTIYARGFFDGPTLYAHIRRGDRVRNLRVGRLRGPCPHLATTRRLFRPSAAPGAYKLHFDANRRFYVGGAQRITYAVRIARSTGRVAASGAAGSRIVSWSRVAR